MTKISEVLKEESADFTDEQIQTFEIGFLALKQEHDNLDVDDYNDSDFREEFVERFDNLFVALGYDEFIPDEFGHILYDLYQEKEFEEFIAFITYCYHQACGDNTILRAIYRSEDEKADREHYGDDYDDEDE